MKNENFYDFDYYENGLDSKKSLYENYRWIPELTIPLAQQFIEVMKMSEDFSAIKSPKILDFGCAKGFLVKAFRELGYEAYGIDVSEYAISQAPSDITNFLSCIKSDSSLQIPHWPEFDYILAKDVLEHIEVSNLSNVLIQLRKLSPRLLVVVPLGDGINYFISDYENDPSHVIKEDLPWWENLLLSHNFKIKSTYDVGILKENWKDLHPKGNGLLYHY